MVTPMVTSAVDGFDHGWRSRANAAFFALIDRYAAHASQWHKRVAFDGLDATSIVEIGPGVGANFSHYPTGSTVWAVEPNAAMHPRLIERARQWDIDLRLVPASATTLPFDDASIDCVVSTLVLCSVDDPERVLAEIHRVLRPAGTFRFVEHIAARSGSPRELLQRILHRPWAWLFEGCDLRRHTDTAIHHAGFGRVDLHHRRLRHSVFIPVNSTITGIAHKHDVHHPTVSAPRRERHSPHGPVSGDGGSAEVTVLEPGGPDGGEECRRHQADDDRRHDSPDTFDERRRIGEPLPR
jgi:SAM-dependent methyltransferase